MDIGAIDADVSSLATATYQGDITDGAFMGDVWKKHDISEVWHLAALLSSRSERSPDLAFTVNAGASASLLEAAAQAGIRRGQPTLVMFPSTIAVYGLPSLTAKRAAGAVSESQWTEALTAYGIHKRTVEELGRYYSTAYKRLDRLDSPAPVDFRAVRYPGIISADTVPTGGTSDYGPEMLHAAAQGKPYECFVRADSRIPFMTMPDAVRALIELARAPRERLTRHVYNVSAFAPSAEEIAAEVKSIVPKSTVSYCPNPARQAIVDSWPEDCDDAAARRDWGWAPQHNLDRAFRDYLGPAVRARYGL